MTWPETLYQSVRTQMDRVTHLIRPDRTLVARRVALSYHILLQNDSPLPQKVLLVIPEPLVCPTQELKTPVSYSAEPDGRGQDTKEGNAFVYWKKTLQAQETLLFTQTYQIELRPNDKRTLLNEESGVVVSSHLENMISSSSPHLSPEHPEIQQIAQELQEKVGRKNIVHLIQAINQRVCALLTYENPIPGLYSAREAIETRKVDCGGFDTLFVSLCLACDIPARVVCGFWTEADQAMHAWAEARLPDGTWIPVDPSLEWLRLRGRTRRRGEVGYTASDRVIYSVGCDLPLVIEEETFVVDILQTPVILPHATPVNATYHFLSRTL